MRRKIILWFAILTPTLIVFLLGIATLGYWTIPLVSMSVSGTPLIAFDPDIGFIPRPNANARRTDGNASFHIYNDARSVRVTRPGDVAPERPDILFIGDSFTWGHGVENEFTFADRVPRLLGVTGANVGMGSYGTTHSFQMLQKNIDRAPQLIVYVFITDHLLRNILPCARAYYPFCLDTSHVMRGKDGATTIAPPWSDGVTRTLVHAKSQAEGLNPVAWLVHGLDVIYGRVLWSIGQGTPVGTEVQNAALEFVLGEMSRSARNIGSKLMFGFVQTAGEPISPHFVSVAGKLNVPLLDLSEDYRSHRANPGAPSLTLSATDAHPSVAGHELIASKMAAFIARENLLK